MAVSEASVADRNATLEEVSQALDLTPCMITDLEGRISPLVGRLLSASMASNPNHALGRKAS